MGQKTSGRVKLSCELTIDISQNSLPIASMMVAREVFCHFSLADPLAGPM
jgi:hypothetical protein